MDDWWKRANTSIFSVVVVDAMNVHQGCCDYHKLDKSPHDWIMRLSKEMIDNTIDQEMAVTHSGNKGKSTSASPACAFLGKTSRDLIRDQSSNKKHSRFLCTF